MQQEILLNKLYELKKVPTTVRNTNLGVDPVRGDGMGQGTPRLSVYNGTVSIYGADRILGEPTAIEAMILAEENIANIHIFETLPDYIYLTGTSTKVVISGAIYDEVGELA